jgi:hypothetical protein
MPLPRLFTTQTIEVSDLNSSRSSGAGEAPSEAHIAKILGQLKPQGYWPTPIVATSNPYAGPGSTAPAPGDFSMTRVGDRTDTSPSITDKPPIGGWNLYPKHGGAERLSGELGGGQVGHQARCVAVLQQRRALPGVER